MMNIDRKLNILMCCHLPLNPTLGGAKVYIEAAETYRKSGHAVDLIGVDDVVGKDMPFLNEQWRVGNFPALLKDYLIKNGSRYDVVEFESIYLPFSMKDQLECILVARSVLLDLHLKKIRIPRFKGMRAWAGFLLKSWNRKLKLNQKISQSLRTMAFADFVNVPNPSDKAILVEYGIESQKIIVQPYGIFEEKFKKYNSISSSKKSPDKKVIAFVGTFDNRKGAVEFPEIIKRVLSMHPEAEFKLLGVIGMFPDEESIYSYIGNEFKNKIHIHGKFKPEDLAELLSDCSLGIFPSYLESFGFGVLEMMALGLPVIGYDSPGINMLLLKDLTVKAGNIDGVCERISRLISDEKFRALCVEKSKNIVGSYVYERQKNISLETYQKKLGIRE